MRLYSKMYQILEYLLLYIRSMGIHRIHEYGVDDALHQNCEIHSPCVGVSGPRLGPIYPYRENVLNPRLPSLHPQQREVN